MAVIVILKNGERVVVEGANHANWYNENLGPANTPDKAALLEIEYKDENTRKTLARFNPKDTVGYIIE